jgi:hypothetical protein
MNSIFMTVTFVIGTILVMLVRFLSDKFGLIFTFKMSAIAAILSIFFVFKLPKGLYPR